MRALIAQRLSGLDALAVGETAAPQPGPGEVLLGVAAASVHMADLAAVAGDRHPRPSLPFTPGLEAAGLVAAVGPQVTGLAPGDRVAAFLAWGALSEGAVVRTALCVKLPDDIPLRLGACLPMVYGGALIALRERARLKAGETLMVLGAGGNIGLGAIEVGKKLGARVIAVATGETRGNEAAERGADDVVDASSRPLSETIASLTDGKGVDVIFDPVGGDALEMAQLSLSDGGRAVVTGFASGRVPRINMSAIFARDGEVISANTLLTVQNDPALAQRALHDVVAWTLDGSIKPRIAAQFDVAQFRPAFDYVKARRNAGAVVVTFGKEN
jgi:NADPH2:quinone reductase